SAATILVGQCLGAGNVPEAKRAVTSGAGLFVILSVCMSIAGLVLAEPMLSAMKTTPESLALAVSYIQVMFLALPVIYVYIYFICILLGAGDSKTPLWSMALTAIVSAILNPIFIFGGGPLSPMGIGGSALAVLVSQAVSLAVLVWNLYHRRHPLCFYKNDAASLRVDWPIVSILLRKGVPIGAQVFVVAFSGVVMMAYVNRFGVETTAAYGASIQLWTYIQLPGLAISTAVSAMVAQSVGARNWKRVRKTTQLAVTGCALVTGLAVLLVYAMGSHAYRLFLPENSSSLEIASHLNKVALWSLIFVMVAVVLFGVMRATGVVMAPLLIHCVSLFGVRFPLAALLIDSWQADAIWWSFSISCAVDLVLATLYYRYGNWRGGSRLLAGSALNVAPGK
ncbi:MAG: MATE family efflux transporter, partial [Pseudomonadota bacterium]|nr:MATE family efflux transporter [Pseudomonadota bacterium]